MNLLEEYIDISELFISVTGVIIGIAEKCYAAKTNLKSVFTLF